MILVEVILAIIVLTHVNVKVWLSMSSSNVIASGFKPINSEPTISIIIALRNEEENVQSLCNSLSQLSYRKSKIEILLGNDASEDRTWIELQKHRPSNAQLFDFDEAKTGSFGKMKVIASLARESKGEYLFFTDADMTFNHNWIQGMLYEKTGQMQLRVGVTKVSGEDWFEKSQSMDWLYNEYCIRWLSKKGFSVSAWGNNMVIDRTTYESVGGFERLKPTILEDVEMMRKILGEGGIFDVQFHSQSLATTKAQLTFIDLFSQRKRWMSNVSKLPIVVNIILLIDALFIPFLILLCFNNLVWIGLLIVKFFITKFLFQKISTVSKDCYSWKDILQFEIYEFALNLVTFALHILPIKVKWKGRVYP